MSDGSSDKETVMSDTEAVPDDVEDIGEPFDSDGDGIPDDLDIEDLDDLVTAAPEEPDDDFDAATLEGDQA